MSFVVLAARLLLGVVFAVSVVAKATDGRAFRHFVAATLRIGWAVRPCVVGIVAAEAVAAGLLLMPVATPWILAMGFGLVLVLLGAFSAALGLALRRQVRVPCGCFGASSTPVAGRHLLRNGALALAAAAGLTGAVSAGPAPLSAGSVGAAALGIASAIVVIRLDELTALFTKDIREYE